MANLRIAEVCKQLETMLIASRVMIENSLVEPTPALATGILTESVIKTLSKDEKAREELIVYVDNSQLTLLEKAELLRFVYVRSKELTNVSSFELRNSSGHWLADAVINFLHEKNRNKEWTDLFSGAASL